MFRFDLRVLVTLATVLLLLPAAGYAQHYVVIDPPGSVSTNATAVNDNNLVVGSYSDSAGATHSFFWLPNGTITSFDVSGSTSTNSSNESLFDLCR